jgi:hypothetical protein
MRYFCHMSSKKKSHWSTGIIGTIIIGLITSFIYDGIKSKPFLTTVGDIVRVCWNAIIAFFTISLQLWWVLLGILVWAIVIWLIKMSRNQTEYDPPPQLRHVPLWYTYTTDVFGGLRYRWEWFKMHDGKYAVNNLQAYCPTHNCRVHGSRCVIGNEQLPTFEFDRQKVEIMIQHAVENNLWQNAK